MKNQLIYISQAMGTPAAWTTNKPTDDYYYELNTWGDHYWFVVMDMDCSQTQVDF